jgi:hypothetical protein
MGGEEYELRIIAGRDCVPPIVRLRQVLKSLLRAHNFRCTSCRDVTPKLPPLPAATPTAAQDEPDGTETTDRAVRASRGRRSERRRREGHWRVSNAAGLTHLVPLDKTGHDGPTKAFVPEEKPS